MKSAPEQTPIDDSDLDIADEGARYV